MVPDEGCVCSGDASVMACQGGHLIAPDAADLLGGWRLRERRTSNRPSQHLSAPMLIGVDAIWSGGEWWVRGDYGAVGRVAEWRRRHRPTVAMPRDWRFADSCIVLS